jgi:hypothetical protein
LVPLRILKTALAALLLASCATTSVDSIIAAHPGKTIAVAYCELDGPTPGA